MTLPGRIQCWMIGKRVSLFRWSTQTTKIFFRSNYSQTTKHPLTIHTVEFTFANFSLINLYTYARPTNLYTMMNYILLADFPSKHIPVYTSSTWDAKLKLSLHLSVIVWPVICQLENFCQGEVSLHKPTTRLNWPILLMTRLAMQSRSTTLPPFADFHPPNSSSCHTPHEDIS